MAEQSAAESTVDESEVSPVTNGDNKGLLGSLVASLPERPTTVLIIGIVLMIGVYSGISLTIGAATISVGDSLDKTVTLAAAIIGVMMIVLSLFWYGETLFGKNTKVAAIILLLTFFLVAGLLGYRFYQDSTNYKYLYSHSYVHVNGVASVTYEPRSLSRYQGMRILFVVMPRFENRSDESITRSEMDISNYLPVPSPNSGRGSFSIDTPNARDNLSYGDLLLVRMLIVREGFNLEAIKTFDDFKLNGAELLQTVGGTINAHPSSGAEIADAFNHLDEDERKTFLRSAELESD